MHDVHSETHLKPFDDTDFDWIRLFVVELKSHKSLNIHKFQPLVQKIYRLYNQFRHNITLHHTWTWKHVMSYFFPVFISVSSALFAEKKTMTSLTSLIWSSRKVAIDAKSRTSWFQGKVPFCFFFLRGGFFYHPKIGEGNGVFFQ